MPIKYLNLINTKYYECLGPDLAGAHEGHVTKVAVKSIARLVDAASKLTRIQPPLGSRPL